MSSVSDAWIWEIMLCDTQLEGLVGTAVPQGLLILGEVARLCPTLCDPVDCSLPGFSVLGILQARILEWVTISFSRGSSRPRDGTQVSRIGGRRFNLWATRVQIDNIFITRLFSLTWPGNIQSSFFFLTIPCSIWDFSSPAGMEPVPPALEAQSLNHWTTGKSQSYFT